MKGVAMAQISRACAATMVICFALICCQAAGRTAVMSADTYTADWRTIDSLKDQGLTESALKIVDAIYTKAKASQNADQMIKAIIFKMRFESYKEEYAFIKALDRLNKEFTDAAFPIAPLLHSMLAECYWHYYQNNRYRFYNRTQTVNFDLKDIHTWDLRTIMDRMRNEYKLSLLNADSLKKIKTDMYHEVITDHDESHILRPTVYDVLAHRAVDFFSADDEGLTKPAFEFTLNNAGYFKPFEEFAELSITTQDTGSLKFHAIKILQDLIAFHAKDRNPEALIDVDLKRLAFVRQHAVLADKDALYLNALQALEKRFPKSPASAEVTYRIAMLYHEWAEAYQPRGNQQTRWMNKKALEVCEQAQKQFPGSFGARHCARLTAEIRAKTMGFTNEEMNVPDKPFKALLSYKNIEKIYWRLVPISIEKYRKMTEHHHDTDSLLDTFTKLKPIKEWSTQAPDPGDYQTHSAEAEIPATGIGHYLILAATDPQFSHDHQAIAYSTTQVSHISYIDRVRQEKNGGHEFYVLDREKGTPMKGVIVKVWMQVYDEKACKYKRILHATHVSDQEGHVQVLPVKKDYNSCWVEFINGEDQLYPEDGEFSLNYYDRDRRSKELHTFFFTDRAIYRPGQTIYFKGIVLRTDGEKSEIAANTSTTVRFYNVNEEEVASLNLKTNKYGSVHGSFVAPVNTLNGQMYISGYNGEAYFSVEDYKRPKFEVTVNPFQGTRRLGENVRLDGYAKAYAGSAIDGATIKYRVVRQARFPNWWWCWWRPPSWSAATEVCNGVGATNDTGGFAIDFTAIPDQAVPKTENPIFTYTVYVDVTDMTGETRSGAGYVNIGYTSLTLAIGIPQQVSKETGLTFPIATANLNRTFEPAKGTILVYRLKTPSQVFRSRLWERPDTAIMTQEQHESRFPFDQYGDEMNIASWEKGDKILEAAFDTQKEKEADLAALKKRQPGVYVLEARTKDQFGQDVIDIRYFTLFSEKERGLPYAMADWYMPIKDLCEPGEKAVFLIGSGHDTVRVLYEIEYKEEIVAKQWITLSNEQKRIEIPVEEKHRGNLSYHLTFVRCNRSYRHDGTITIPWTNKELDIAFETFRNKLAPGEKEEWRLKITGKNKDKVVSEMVATLYDASLDAFAMHWWNFNIYPYRYASRAWAADRCFTTQQANVYQNNWNEYPGTPHRYYPELNWFGYNFEGSYYYGSGGGKVMSKKAMSEDDAMAAPMAGRSAPAEKEATTARAMQAAPAPPPAKEPQKDNDAAQAQDLSTVATRTNLNETAFFYPLLETNKDGDILVKFQVPEALTKWRMMGFAHTKDLKYGQTGNMLVTQKDLMVMPNAPRFFRENDRITFTAKVSNLADKDLTGAAQLMLFNAATMEPVDAAFQNKKGQIPFTAKKGQSAKLAWDLAIPEGIGAVTFRTVAKAGAFSDGEEQTIPVLSNSMMLTEGMPLPIRKKETKKFTFEKLVSQNNGSTTLRNFKLTLEFTSNPAWYAIQALPYLMEYPYECAEQVFSRFYANTIAASIANSSPRIKAVFDSWKPQQSGALLSNLEKNQELKSLTLEETPWLLDGKDESERKKRIGLLFDLNKMGNEKERALSKLKKLQLSNGGWPWFEGMPDDRYITQYIATGLGRLGHLGMADLRTDNALWDMTQRCLAYLDDRIREDHESILRSGSSPDLNHLGEIHIQYLYARSYFKDVPIASRNKKAFDYFLGQAKQYWLKNRRYMQGMMALALNRYSDAVTPGKIMRSLKENSITSEEMGMYWKEMYEQPCYWCWYDAPIESQALMVEAFDEVAHDTASVEDLKAWLLKSKQTQNWRTTKATAEACYALLLRGAKWLERKSTVTLTLGATGIDAAKPKGAELEAGTGYFKTSWSGAAITPAMGNITVAKSEAGVAWGAVYWQYSEQLDKITPHETPLKLAKKLFLEQNTPTGPVITPVNEKTALKPGDKLKVRIELRVDRDMEYVHMKDMRASGFEPLNVFSGYRWQDGLGYYESTRDAATNFFFGALRKGTYVFEYPLSVTHAGDFSNGISTIQCMYAPEFTSHGEGIRMKVGK